ncbi:MAG: AAA family ATPase [Gaiellaceae bacterium]
MAVCAACRQENPDHARFCLHCGAPLAAVEHREERRVVSVLFADIVGFTSKAEELDPEDVRSFLTPYYGRVRAEIEAHGGRLEKFVGDAVLGIFGVPVAHGDDAERAVRAALAIRDALPELNTLGELELQLRIAVNTGEAIVDLDARPEQGETMVVGDVVNTASRLQSAAPVNGVLVGSETQAATRSAIAYAPVAPVFAKGKAAPVPAWVALEAASDAGQRALSDAPLVGRDRDLDVLARIWDQVRAERRPHLVNIIGPAGIGKSRLAEEFARRVLSEGGFALRGRCVPYGDSSAYGAFAQHIKQVAAIFDNDSEDVAREKLAGLGGDDGAELAQSLALLLGFESDQSIDRESLFFAARQFVEGVARGTPTMLVFEDIHWADSSLLDLIEVLGARAEGVPLLFVALTRPELFTTRPGWGGGNVPSTSLSLEALTEADARRLADELLAKRDGALADRLAASAEGNPLFIEELAAAVTERAAGDFESMPTTIRSILGARLDALGPAERSLLLDAAVVGKVFWRGVLERMHGGGDVRELLGSLEARALIRREAVSRIRGDQQFAFKHGLIREVAYATVPRARRRERHAMVAEFFEESTTETGESAATLAFHWQKAGESARALPYLLAAAEHAGKGWAKERAVALYTEAFALLPEGDERRRGVAAKRAVAIQALFHVPDAARLAGRDDLA